MRLVCLEDNKNCQVKREKEEGGDRDGREEKVRTMEGSRKDL